MALVHEYVPWWFILINKSTFLLLLRFRQNSRLSIGYSSFSLPDWHGRYFCPTFWTPFTYSLGEWGIRCLSVCFSTSFPSLPRCEEVVNNLLRTFFLFLGRKAFFWQALHRLTWQKYFWDRTLCAGRSSPFFKIRCWHSCGRHPSRLSPGASTSPSTVSDCRRSPSLAASSRVIIDIYFYDKLSHIKNKNSRGI